MGRKEVEQALAYLDSAPTWTVLGGDANPTYEAIQTLRRETPKLLAEVKRLRAKCNRLLWKMEHSQ